MITHVRSSIHEGVTEKNFQIIKMNQSLKALSHYNVLANVCQRMKYISSTLAYAEI